MPRILLSALLLHSAAFAQTVILNENGIVNGATFTATPLARGSIASAFGGNFGTNPNAVVFRINGIIAPVLAVTPAQINFLIPSDSLIAPPSATANVTVNGVTSNTVRFSITDVGPGIFTISPSGRGAVLIANSATIVAPEAEFAGSRPARRGEFISIYCTGLGAVQASPNGPITPTLPTLLIGGRQAAAIFSGLAPGFPGLYQVNVQIPLDVPVGNQVPMFMTMGGAGSNTVNIAVSGLAETKLPGGPLGGHVTSLVLDERNPETLFAGTDGAGIFKTTDGALTWTSIVTFESIRSLAIDPSNSFIVYAGTVLGILKSADGGATWSSAGLRDQTVYALAISPLRPAVVYAATSSGLQVSPDRGATWTQHFAGQVTAVAIDPVDFTAMYLGLLSGGIFRVTSQSPSWAFVYRHLATVEAIVIDPANPASVVAAGGPWVSTSRDRGLNWIPSMMPFGSGHALAFDRAVPGKLFVGTTEGILHSTNGGPWRSELMPPQVNQNLQALATHPTNSNIFYAASRGSGVLKSVNAGVNWNPFNTGLLATNILSLAVDRGNPETVYAGAVGGVFKSTDHGATWTGERSGLPNRLDATHIALDPASPATLYAGTLAGPWRNSLTGSPWTEIANGLRGSFVTALAVDRATPGALVLGAGMYAYRSTDRGETWQQILGEVFSGVLSVAIHPTNSLIIYAGTREGIFRTTNGGTNWTQSATPGAYINLVVIDPSNPAVIYAAAGTGGIAKSNDGGQTWSSLNTGFTGFVSCLVIDPANPAILYAGVAGGGVYKSNNGGASWSAVNSGLVSLNVQSLAVGSDGVYAGTKESGVYKSTNGGTTWAPTGTQ